jgi:hypothetical protein
VIVLEIPNLESQPTVSSHPESASKNCTDSLVQPSAKHGLDRPSDRGKDTEDAGGDVALREHGDGVDQTRGAGCYKME